MTQTNTTPAHNGVSVEKIAIIGGGFSGVCVALNILDRALSAPNPPQQQYDITIYNTDSKTFAGGIAYGQASEEHYTNIPVRMMSAFAHRPNDLMEWIDAHKGIPNLLRPELKPYNLDTMDDESLVPRRLYQFYLQNRLELMGAEALHRNLLVAPVTRIHQEVTSLPTNSFDRIVLALGHIEEKKPAFLDNLPDDAKDKIITNAWAKSDKLHTVLGDPTTQSVAVIGTGLSSYDIALTAKKEGFFDNPNNRLYSISRHGYEHDHTAKTNIPLPVIARTDIPDPPKDIADVPDYVGGIYQKYQKAGFENWAIEQGLRPLVPALIAESGIPMQELAALIPQYSARINTGVVGVGSEVVSQIQELKDNNQLEIITGEISKIGADSDNIGILVKETMPNGSTRPRLFTGAILINAAGLNNDYRHSKSPLINDMVQNGILTPDQKTGVGAAVDDQHHPIDGNGIANQNIYVIGALALGYSYEKGLFGPKAVNAPTLRIHAGDIANDITGIAPAPAPTQTILPSGPQGRTATTSIVPEKIQKEAKKLLRNLQISVQKWPDRKEELCTEFGDIAQERGNEHLFNAITEHAANHPKRAQQQLTKARHWFDTERTLRAPNKRMVP